MQRPDVQDHHAQNDEGQQEVQREEPGQRGIVRRETAQQPFLEPITDQRKSGEEASDDLRRPIGHLPPRQDVTHERGRHHQQEDGHAQQPDHFTRGFVRAVVKPAEDVQIDHRKEQRSAVRMRITQHPAPVDVAHDVLG